MSGSRVRSRGSGLGFGVRVLGIRFGAQVQGVELKI